MADLWLDRDWQCGCPKRVRKCSVVREFRRPCRNSGWGWEENRLRRLDNHLKGRQNVNAWLDDAAGGV